MSEVPLQGKAAEPWWTCHRVGIARLGIPTSLRAPATSPKVNPSRNRWSFPESGRVAVQMCELAAIPDTRSAVERTWHK